jgi:hypothetical protein
MSVVSIRLLFAGQSSETSIEKRTYKAAWMVEVNNPQDNQVVVTNALSGRMGTVWAGFGIGIDVQAALKTLGANRVPDSRLWWIVEGSWETPGNRDDRQRDENGNASDNPDDWRDQVERGSAKYTVPVEKAKIYTELQQLARPVGSEGPVINAAGDVFDPPLEREESHGIYRIVRTRKTFPPNADDFENAINKDTFTISKPGLRRNFKPRTLKMEPITGSLQYHRRTDGREVAYWKITFEIHHNKNGWRTNVLNRGVNRRAMAGDKDDRGKVISELDLGTGKSKKRRISDGDDFPSGPVLLDINGQPLATNAQPVYLEYGFYEEKNFRELGI